VSLFATHRVVCKPTQLENARGQRVRAIGFRVGISVVEVCLKLPLDTCQFRPPHCLELHAGHTRTCVCRTFSTVLSMMREKRHQKVRKV